MIFVLLVDDDTGKRERIAEVLVQAVGESRISVRGAATVADAVKYLEVEEYDLLVLDINIPLRPGESPRRDGGLRLLRQLVRSGAQLRRPQHIVGLTAFDDLHAESSRELGAEAWHLLKYGSDEEAWQDTLAKLSQHISAAKVARTQRLSLADLGIVTALKPIELEAVLALPCRWQVEGVDGDDTIYHVGVFERGAQRIKVVAAAAIEMGSAAAACVTLKMCNRYNPRYVVMCGIAAGVAGAQFGDILIADQCWDYGAGKIATGAMGESVFAPAPNYIAIDADTKEKLELFRMKRRSALAAIRDSWPGTVPATALQMHLGPVATGAAVVENAEIVQNIKEHNKKLIGVEMETYGVYVACRTALDPKPRFFSAKAVCDFALPGKGDEYQKYAAYCSAHFVFEFSLDQIATIL